MNSKTTKRKSQKTVHRLHGNARKTPHRQNKGFTIVEIMIVLAIAGLILLVVLLAVPALQRMTRNTQRREDVLSLLAYMQEYRTANGGKLPPSCNTSQHSHCFLRDANLSFYDNKTLSAASENNISWHNRGDLQMIDPPPDTTDGGNVIYKVSIRSYSNCDKGYMSGETADKMDMAAQYVTETFSGHVITCIEY